MMKRILANTTMRSALGSQSALKPKAALGKKALVITLILTSLVDVFSILVIYLLVNTSASQEITLKGDIELPIAHNTSVIESGLVLRIDGKDLYIDDQIVASEDLLSKLEEMAMQTLIIQADRKIAFSELSPILLIASRTGYSKVRFAVIRGDGAGT